MVYDGKLVNTGQILLQVTLRHAPWVLSPNLLLLLMTCQVLMNDRSSCKCGDKDFILFFIFWVPSVIFEAIKSRFKDLPSGGYVQISCMPAAHKQFTLFCVWLSIVLPILTYLMLLFMFSVWRCLLNDTNEIQMPIRHHAGIKVPQCPQNSPPNVHVAFTKSF